ncbi:MAG: hypothetical protein LBD06_08255 [Candidatus Accumulibacter sp.]|nr:hypothetical protein [Accumulibacter sp.]
MKPSCGVILSEDSFRGQISEDSYLRGQKTDEFAALSRRIRWKNPSLGFSSLTRRDSAANSPVFSPHLSSVLCLLSSGTVL